MDPVCFHIGSRPIYWYGILVALGFLAAVANWNALGTKGGRPAGFGSELGFWIMLSGILGARAAYILANLSIYLSEPLETLRLDKGGLIFYGGFIGAVVCVVFLARAHKEPVMKLADFTVTGLPIGHAIGRVGCFINGCCYGSVTTVPWGVCAQDAVRHPTQLYESAFNLLVYGILLWFFPRRKHNGQVLALYLLTYPVGRFLLEFFRGDERLHWLGFNVAQEISVGMFAIGVALWFGLWAKAKKANG
jgi:phosphatidylglycerol:prolipoprotein diacylglycerol transferase